MENDLCIGCGTCAALCPKGILEMKWNKYGEYIPVEITPCNNECGMCLKVCPFMESENNEDVIGKNLYGSVPGIFHRSETGFYLSAYVGHADMEHRSSGASGGMATWIIERLLEEGIVDHTICVTPNNDSEKLFNFTIFYGPEEVRKGAGSAYYPVEMSGVIKHILETPGRYAIIGLPCFIKAIRLAQMKNKKLNERIVITLGLVCGQLKNKCFTDYIAALAGVRGKVTMVRYRGKSLDRPVYNYYYIFINDRGEQRQISWDDGISEAWLNRWFTPKACNYCDDIFAECADTVCMDAWLPEYSQDSEGTNLVLVRSPVIKRIIDDGIRSNKIFMDTISIEKVIQSQEGVITLKRQHLSNRLCLDLYNRRLEIKKRVAPIKPKYSLRLQIDVKEQMRITSRELWNSDEPDLKAFTKKMQTYLKKINNSNKIFSIISFLIKVIKQRIRGSNNG